MEMFMYGVIGGLILGFIWGHWMGKRWVEGENVRRILKQWGRESDGEEGEGDRNSV